MKDKTFVRDAADRFGCNEDPVFQELRDRLTPEEGGGGYGRSAKRELRIVGPRNECFAITGEHRFMGRNVKKRSAEAGEEPESNESESALLARLRAGDEEAFASLVSSYYGALIRFAMSFVAERSAAEEVVQETWLGVIRGLSSFEGRSSLKTWIFRILANRAKTRGKREARSIPFSSLKDPQSESDYEPAVDPSRFDARGMWTDPPHPWARAAPEELLLRQETMDLIQRAIAELPPSQRAVVTLHDVEGVEADEICNILEISQTNKRVLLHRARSKLRCALEASLMAGTNSRPRLI